MGMTTAQGQLPGGTPGYGSPKVALYNVDEAWTSKKNNQAQLYIDAAVQDTLYRLLAASQLGQRGGSPGAGVLTGMESSVVAGAVNIQPGMAFIDYTGGSLPAGASPFQWAESDSVVIPTINLNTSPTLNQWALVYCSPEMTVDTNAATVVWNSALNPPNGAPQNTNLAQDQYPQASFGVVYGALATNPTIPALAAGQIPVVAVYLGPSSAAITSASLTDARVILSPGAYGRHGIEHGFVLGTTDAGAHFNISKGRAYVDGHPVILGDDLVPTVSLFSCLMQTIPAASTSYYMYLIPVSTGSCSVGTVDSSYSVNTPATGGGFMLAASTVAPTSDGHPSSAISYQSEYGVGDTHVYTTTSALFVGSVLTDAGAEVIPFRRLGDRVLLIEEQTAVPTAGLDTGALGRLTMAPSSGVVLTDSFTQAPPVSASGYIVDVTVTNSVGVADAFFLDPDITSTYHTSWYPVAHLASTGSSSETAFTGLVLPAGVANPNVISLVALGSGWDVYVVFRGYIEPLKSLA